MEKDTTVGKNKIAGLFDPGTFAEIGAYLKRDSGETAGVICGYGAVNGKLTYAFAQDSDRQKGAFDAVQAKKIATVYEMALKNGAPVVGVFDSIGAYINDGAGVMFAYGTLLASVSRASGRIPQIALIAGVCSGMAATAAAMFDVVVTVKEQSGLFVNAPFLVGKDVGTAEFVAENGLSSMTADSEAEAMASVRELIALLPSNCEEGVVAEDVMDDVNRLVAVDGVNGKALCETVADAGRFLELGASYGAELVTGFCKIGGVCCGVVAGTGNALTGDSAKKAAKLVSFCDSFSIPVVTLIDSEGIAVSRAEEGSPLAAQLGKMAMAYATADTAKITAVVGKAYGAAFTLLGSRALGADLVYAIPNASISVMAPEAAVAFLWNQRVSKTVIREDLVEEWNSSHASPEAAAEDGSIDDVIPAAELRSRICSAVYMLLVKNGEGSYRKHCNLPL